MFFKSVLKFFLLFKDLDKNDGFDFLPETIVVKFIYSEKATKFCEIFP